MYQTIIVVCVSTTGIVVIGSRLAEYTFRRRNYPGMLVGELKPGLGIFAWWREHDALDRAWVFRRIVGNGEVIEEVVFGIGSIASIRFEEIVGIVPKAVKDTSVTC